MDLVGTYACTSRLLDKTDTEYVFYCKTVSSGLEVSNRYQNVSIEAIRIANDARSFKVTESQLTRNELTYQDSVSSKCSMFEKIVKIVSILKLIGYYRKVLQSREIDL